MPTFPTDGKPFTLLVVVVVAFCSVVVVTLFSNEAIQPSSAPKKNPLGESFASLGAFCAGAAMLSPPPTKMPYSP